MTWSKVAFFDKDPTEKLDYGFDWSDALQGDEIATSVWVVQAGLTQSSSPTPTNDTKTTTIWLESGTAGTDYSVMNKITTSVGRTLTASMVIRVTDSAAAP